MKRINFSFNSLLLCLGIVLALGVAFHLWYRRETYPVGPVWEVRRGSPSRGRELIGRYGCGSCHIIPGIPQASGRVGPKLTDLKFQIYIGGMLPNTPENLSKWIQNPQHYAPGTAMPNLGISERDARDIAGYLFGSPPEQPERER